MLPFIGDASNFRRWRNRGLQNACFHAVATVTSTTEIKRRAAIQNLVWVVAFGSRA